MAATCMFPLVINLSARRRWLVIFKSRPPYSLTSGPNCPKSLGWMPQNLAVIYRSFASTGNQTPDLPAHKLTAVPTAFFRQAFM